MKTDNLLTIKRMAIDIHAVIQPNRVEIAVICDVLFKTGWKSIPANEVRLISLVPFHKLYTS